MRTELPEVRCLVACRWPPEFHGHSLSWSNSQLLPLNADNPDHDAMAETNSLLPECRQRLIPKSTCMEFEDNLFGKFVFGNPIKMTRLEQNYQHARGDNQCGTVLDEFRV